MHIAAVNPDPTVFKLFFKHNPTASVLDSEQRDIVHYAAANANPEILEHLVIKRVELLNNSKYPYSLN